MFNWLVSKAYAYTVSVPLTTDSKGNPVTQYTSFSGYVVDLINQGIKIAEALAVLMILWGAYKYVTSGGDQAQTKEGKDIIVSALVGFALLVLIRILMPIIQIQ